MRLNGLRRRWICGRPQIRRRPRAGQRREFDRLAPRSYRYEKAGRAHDGVDCGIAARGANIDSDTHSLPDLRRPDHDGLGTRHFDQPNVPMKRSQPKTKSSRGKRDASLWAVGQSPMDA
jgi:hypothetical protein